MIDSKGKVNILVIIIIIVVQLLAVAAVWWFFIKEPAEEAPAGPTAITKTDVELPPPPPATSTGDNKSSSTSDNTTPTGKALDFIKDYAIFNLGDVVLNPMGAEKNTFFITTISFEYRLSDKNIAVELKNKTPIFRDLILSYFARVTLDDLKNFEKRDTFKEDIQRMVNGSLLEGKITNVLFEQFVIQS